MIKYKMYIIDHYGFEFLLGLEDMICLIKQGLLVRFWKIWISRKEKNSHMMVIIQLIVRNLNT